MPRLPAAPLPWVPSSPGIHATANAGEPAPHAGGSPGDAGAPTAAPSDTHRFAELTTASARRTATASADPLCWVSCADALPVPALPAAAQDHALADVGPGRDSRPRTARDTASNAWRFDHARSRAQARQALVEAPTPALPPRARRPLIMLGALLLLGLSAGPLLAGSQDRAALITAGNAAFKAQDYAAAAKSFYQASVLKPDDAVTLYGVAACEYLQGRSATAKAWVELSLTRDPSSAKTLDLVQRLGLDPLLVEAVQAEKSGRAAEALLKLEAVKEASRDAFWWRVRCASFIDLDRLEEAEGALDQARALGPKNYDLKSLSARFEKSFMDLLAREDPFSYQSRLGMQAFRRGDHQGATGPLTRATELGPDEASAWYNLALNQWQLGDAQGTRLALQRCLELDPQHAGGLYLKAAYLSKAQQEDQAQAVLRSLAQGSDAAWAGMAARELAAKPSASSAPASNAITWHLYARAIGGPNTTVTHDSVSETALKGDGSQDYLRLSGEQWVLPVLWLSGAYSVYVTPSKTEASDWALGEPYHAADLDSRWQPWAWGALTAGYTGALRHGSGIVTYYANSARLGVDLKAWGLDSLALVGSAQSERYPSYGDFDAISGAGTLTATWSDQRGDGLSLSVAGRECQTLNTLWSTRYALASATLRVVGPWSTQLSLFGSLQPTLFPNFSDGNGGQRFDNTRYGTAELSMPIVHGVYGLLGGQWSDTASNIVDYGNRNSLAYIGLWTWL